MEPPKAPAKHNKEGQFVHKYWFLLLVPFKLHFQFPLWARDGTAVTETTGVVNAKLYDQPQTYLELLRTLNEVLFWCIRAK